MEELYNEIGQFAQKTFPEAGPKEHLLKLKQEADEAIAEPGNMEEYADCLIGRNPSAYRI